MLRLIKVPLNLGRVALGTELAPYILENLFRNQVGVSKHIDSVNINCPSLDSFPKTDICDNMMFPNQIITVCKELSSVCAQSMKQGGFLVVLGGDHAVSWGSISGAKQTKNNLGIIYIDAHGDCNIPERSPSLHVHGMHMAFLMGLGNEKYNSVMGLGKINLEDILYVGTRSLDPYEEDLLVEGQVFSTQDVIEDLALVNNGISKFIERYDNIHVSFDVDVLDPELFPATGVPVQKGLQLDSVFSMLETIFKSGKAVSADIVEYNPLLDIGDKSNECIKSIVCKISSFICNYCN